MLNRRSFFAASAAGIAGTTLPVVAPALEKQTVKIQAPPTGGFTVFYYPPGNGSDVELARRIIESNPHRFTTIPLTLDDFPPGWTVEFIKNP